MVNLHPKDALLDRALVIVEASELILTFKKLI